MFNQRALRYGSVVDGLLRVGFRLGRLLRRRSDPVALALLKPEKIVVLESQLLGDAIMTLPLPQGLRHRFPNADIWLLANPPLGDLSEFCRLVGRVVQVSVPWSTYDDSLPNLRRLGATLVRMRAEDFDLSIDTRGDLRNNFLLWLIGAPRRLGFARSGGEYFLTDVVDLSEEITHLVDYRCELLKPLGAEVVVRQPSLHVADAATRRIEAVLDKAGIDPRGFVALHPGSSVAAKCWPAVRCAQFADALQRLGVSVILVGGPADGPLLEEVCSQVTLPVTLCRPSLEELRCSPSRAWLSRWTVQRLTSTVRC
jgi:ADP-heptose:LPS heptosyltransferase